MLGAAFCRSLLVLRMLARRRRRERSLAEAGRRIYEQGMLPDGRPCAPCARKGLFSKAGTPHAPSAIGERNGDHRGVAGGHILVPRSSAGCSSRLPCFAGPITISAHRWVPNHAWARALNRSAYDEKGSRVRCAREWIRTGIPSWPRCLAMRSMTVGVRVGGLPAEAGVTPAPGVKPDTLHVATIVTPDVPPERAEKVLDVVRTWVAARGPVARLEAARLEALRPAGGWEQELDARYRHAARFRGLSGVGAASGRRCSDSARRAACPASSIGGGRPGRR